MYGVFFVKVIDLLLPLRDDLYMRLFFLLKFYGKKFRESNVLLSFEECTRINPPELHVKRLRDK